MYHCFPRAFRIAVLALAGMLAGSAYANGDFALLDQHGHFHQLSRYAEHDAVVILVAAADDQTSSRAVTSLTQVRQNLVQQSPDENFVFLLLFADADPDRAVVQSMAEEQGIDLPVLIDEAQIVLTTLDARQLGEVFVLDPGSQDVIYRGALGASDDEGAAQASTLQQTLGEILASRSVTVEAVAATGPEIDYRYQRQLQAQSISYQNDIAPLLQRRCAHCHVEQGLAPWAMNRHLMVMGWSPMIREVVITRRMPPGQIDGYIGDWQQTHELPPEELAMLIHWIDQGAPRMVMLILSLSRLQMWQPGPLESLI